MPFTLQELRGGVHYWRQTRWPQDFHNDFYGQLLAMQQPGNFNENWWEATLPILRRWRAIRPKRAELLTDRARARFVRMGELWNEHVAPHYPAGDIGSVRWSDGIADFAQCIAEIKGVESPVFTSKLLHFLAPKIFPVIDRNAMGLPFASYLEYFQQAQVEWRATHAETRQELIVAFGHEIQNIADHFPTKAKVIELCYIGRHDARIA